MMRSPLSMAPGETQLVLRDLPCPLCLSWDMGHGGSAHKLQYKGPKAAWAVHSPQYWPTMVQTRCGWMCLVVGTRCATSTVATPYPPTLGALHLTLTPTNSGGATPEPPLRNPNTTHGGNAGSPKAGSVWGAPAITTGCMCKQRESNR